MRKVWPWLQMLAGVAIIGVLIWKVGTQSFVDSLRVVNAASILAALGIGFGTTVASARRWCLVARRLGLQLTLAQAVSDCYRALFLNSVLPAGVLGDVHRAWKHGKQEGDIARAVQAVVLERVAGQAVLIAVGAVVLLGTPSLLPGSAQYVVWAVAVSAALVVSIFVVSGRRARRGASLRRTPDDVRIGLLLRDAWPGLGLLSLAALCGHITLFVVAADATGLNATVGQVLPLAVLSLLAMSLPLNVGGWGPREGVTALAFGAVGLGAAQGLTTAVAYGVLALIASLPGALVLVDQAPVVQRWGRKRYATGSNGAVG